MSQILESPHLGLRREKGANLGEREVGVREVSKTSKKVKSHLQKKFSGEVIIPCRQAAEMTVKLLTIGLFYQVTDPCSYLLFHCRSALLGERANILISWSLREVFIILSTGASGT